jgi:crotonobetaine/carnitine-CoA ligase
MMIADDEGTSLPLGHVGEILLRPTFPNQFMKGYHNAPELTALAWRDGWLKTGDLGSMDEAGNLYFVGRKAHWLRRRGENISAYEIEAVLSGHPGVFECVIVGVKSEIGEDDVKAFIIRDLAPS